MSPANPGPWVNPEIVEAQPWKSHDGIVKFFEFPVPIAAMSSRAFHLYWQKHHSPQVMHLTAFSQFMRKYLSTHRYPGTPVALPNRYELMDRAEGAAEVWLNRISEVGDWLGHPLYPELIQPDEPRFIAQDGSAELVITKEERIFRSETDLPENLATKVYLIASRGPNQDYDSFHLKASDYGKAIYQEPVLGRHLTQLIVNHRLRDPLPLEGFEFAKIDAIVELWFADLGAANRFFAEPEFGKLATAHEEGLCEGRALRALTVKVRVVHDEFSFQPSTTQPLPFSW